MPPMPAALWLPLATWPRLRVERRPFRPLLTPDEQEAVWHAFAARGAWDGPTVRLIAVEADGWTVAPSTYRAWCASHGLADWAAPPPGASTALLSAWRRVQTLSPPLSWSDLLSRPGWANTLGLMVFLRDPTGQVWAVRRSSAVVEEPGAWTATVTGTVDPQDLADPAAALAAACRREIAEETGVAVLRLHPVGLAACAPKWQPSLIAWAAVAEAPGQRVAPDGWEAAAFAPLAWDSASLVGLSRVVWPAVRACIAATTRMVEAP